MNLPEVLDHIWKSHIPRTAAATEAAPNLDEPSQVIVQALCSYVLGRSTLTEFEHALRHTDRNFLASVSPGTSSSELSSILAGLQLARDHLDGNLFKPAEERNRWYASAADDLNISVSSFKRLLAATEILEQKALLRHDNRN